MSTASRDCGKTGGARARCFNAPSAPGASVGPRGHYDPRAFGQLGSLKKTVLKRPPEAEIAARLKAWKKPAPRYTRGVLAKYASTVATASEGAVTDKYVSP